MHEALDAQEAQGGDQAPAVEPARLRVSCLAAPCEVSVLVHIREAVEVPRRPDRFQSPKVR